jgi:hypothetical protein
MGSGAALAHVAVILPRAHLFLSGLFVVICKVGSCADRGNRLVLYSPSKSADSGYVLVDALIASLLHEIAVFTPTAYRL